jgi:predicted transcriptional regulator
MNIKQLRLQHEILGLVWHRRDERTTSGLSVRITPQLISKDLEITNAQAEDLMKDLVVRGLLHKRRGDKWEFNFRNEGVTAYEYGMLLKEVYNIFTTTMNEINYTECDEILRYFYERRTDFTVHIWREVYEALGLDPTTANLYLQFLEDDDMLECTSKGIGGYDGQQIEMTRKGRLFFAKTNYMKENQNQATDAQQVHYNVHVASNTGNIILASTFNDAVVQVKSESAEAAEYLNTIKLLIEQSGNDQAVTYFDNFNTELAKTDKNKHMLNLLWTGIETAMSHAPALVDAGHKLLANLNII